MPVVRRGDSFQAAVSLKGRRYRRQFPSKVEAEVWEADAKAALLKGAVPDMGDRAPERADQGTLGALVERVHETHWKHQSSEDRPLKGVQDLLTVCPKGSNAPCIGSSKPVEKLKREEVDRARAALIAKGNSPATVNRKVAALSKALSIYEDDHPEYHKPKLAKFKEAEGRIRRFTKDEEAAAIRFFERIGNPDMADFVVVAVDTGMRLGETLTVRYEDAQDGRKVTVWGIGAKSGKTRSVPLTGRVRELLAGRMRDLKASPRDLVFGALTKRKVTHYWNRFAASLDLFDDPNFVPHILRHEFCSRLSDLDVNAKVIQELAGHSSLQVTQRYIHVRAESLMSAIARLGGGDVDLVAEQPHAEPRGTTPDTQAKATDLGYRRKQQDQVVTRDQVAA